jgi:hypothetical protein
MAKAGAVRRAYDSTKQALGNAAESIGSKISDYKEKYKENKIIKKEQQKLDEEYKQGLEKRADELMPFVEHMNKYSKKVDKKTKRRNRWITGLAATLASYGAYEGTGIRQGVEDTATPVIYAVQAVNDTKNLVKNIATQYLGKNPQDLSEIEKAFPELKDKISREQKMTNSALEQLYLIQNNVDKFNVASTKVPAPGTVDKMIDVGSKVHSLESRAVNKIGSLFGAKDNKEEVEDRLDPNYPEKYNAVINQMGEGYAQLRLTRTDIKSINEDLKNRKITLEEAKKRLSEDYQKTEELESFLRNARKLKTPQINHDQKEYKDIIKQGEELGLNINSPETLAYQIALAAGLSGSLMLGYGVRKFGDFVPRIKHRKEMTKKGIVKYLRQSDIDPKDPLNKKEGDPSDKYQKGDLEKNLGIILLGLSPIILLIAGVHITNKITGNFILNDFSSTTTTLINITPFIWIACALVFFLLISKFYKHKTPDKKYKIKNKK